MWSAYRKAAEGTWVGHGSLLWDLPPYQVSKGDPFHATLSLQEGACGSVLSGNLDFQVKTRQLSLQSHVVTRWDPGAQGICLIAFWSNGFVEELFFSRQEANTFFGTYASKAPGLPKQIWPICLQFPDPDSFEYKFLGGPYEGNVLSSWKRERK